MFGKKVNPEVEALARAKATRIEAETLLAEAKSREAAAQKAAKGGSWVARLLLIGILLFVGYVFTRPDAPVTDVQAAAAPVAEAPASTRQATPAIRCDELTEGGSVLFNLYSRAACDDGPATSPTRQASELRPVARPAEMVIVEAAAPAASAKTWLEMSASERDAAFASIGNPTLSFDDILEIDECFTLVTAIGDQSEEDALRGCIYVVKN